MPDFGTPFAGLANDRKLTHELAESIDNKLAIEVLKDIADEERIHAGEFLRLLKYLAPDEEKFYAEGTEEVEEIEKNLGLA